MVLLYDPTAPRRIEPPQPRRGLPTLAGKIVGFIDNAKPNFDHLVDDLAELLVANYGVARVIKRRKPSASLPAAPQLLTELGEECDLVITGSGD